MDAKKAWQPIHKLIVKNKARFEAGIKEADKDEELSKTLLRTGLEKDPPSADAEIEGARLALLGNYFDGKSRIGEMLEHAVALGGLRFGLETLLASHRYARKTQSEYSDAVIWVTALARAQDVNDTEPWVRLRHMADATPKKERAAMSALAHETGQKASRAMRAMLAFLAPDDDTLWTGADTAHGLVESTPQWERVMSFVIAELRRTKLGADIDPERWGVPDADAIAKALPGDSAVPSLRLLLAWGEDGVAEALAKIGSELALRVLAEDSADRRVLPVFAKAVEADPKLAIRAIAPAFEPRKKGEKRTRLPLIARAHLVAAVAAHPELAKESAALAKDAGILAKQATELPTALVTPPWRMPKPDKKKAAPKKSAEPKELVMLEYEEKLDWGKRNPKDLYELNVHKKEEKETVKRALDEAKKEGRSFLLYVMWVGDENARKLLREIQGDQWYGQEDDVEAILARFGFEMLGPMLAFAKSKPDVSKGFLSVDSPRVAPHMAHLLSNNKKMKATASEWLLKFPRAAAIGLLPAMSASTGKPRASLEEAVRHVASKHAKIVSEVAAEYKAPDLVTSAAASKDAKYKQIREPKLPDFFDAESLPRPLLEDGKALGQDAMTDFAKLLSVSKLDDPHPGVLEVKQACDPASLARFAFGLFIQWLGADGPAKHAWAFYPLGFFGDAECARVLGPMAKDWAPGGLPQRAQAAVDVLAAMGHDAALLAVHNLSKVRSKALARHAEKTMAAIAKQRGMTGDELADRLIPDLGLSENGTMSFDYGQRRFTLGFDAELAPFVRSQSGEILEELPKGQKTDDEYMVTSALEDWKEIKKRARQVAREQARRLELAMASRRRFSIEHFETFFSRHPFMQHLTRRVVWAFHDEKTQHPFRVAEDGSYADAQEEELDLPLGADIGIVHPLELDAKALARWGEIFGQYEIVQPFAQLSREVHRDPKALRAFVGKSVPTTKILGLRRAGWREGPTEGGGNVSTFAREAGAQSAVLGIEPGVYLGDPSMEPTQKVASIEVPNDVDAILFSEVVRDLDALVRD